MPHLELFAKERVSPARRIAIGTWRRMGDPSVYGAMTVEVDPMLDFIERFRDRTGIRLTLSHVMAKIMGEVYAEMPDANALLRFGKLYLRREVAVFFQVAMEDPQTGEIDLSGVVVRDPSSKTLIEIAQTFQGAAERVRRGKDREKEATRQLFRRLPGFLVGPLLDLVAFGLYSLNLDLTWLGLPRDAFGSALITNIGSLGLDEAYAPLVPYTRAPLVISLGAVRRQILPDDAGQPRLAHTLRIGATFDHRILDGVHAARMARVVQRCFADPEGALGGGSPPAAPDPENQTAPAGGPERSRRSPSPNGG
ncbi:MAG: 2-oxo acid dehydrogenase [Deltaproteobacteria bacterium]|nr:MAG: 2-oxo acid dehydrogenase [Deltaproteobacteria bacterium]